MAISTQQLIADAIYTAIKTSIGSSVGNRIYELEAPQDTRLPLCRYQIIIDVVDNMLSCSDQEITLQVNLFGKRTSGVKALRTISDALFDDLDRSQLTISGVSTTMIGTEQGVVTVEDEEIINIRQEYQILIN
jgi:hypothetical protein